MESRRLADARNPWTLAMLTTLRTTQPRSASEQTAYGKWFDQRSDRENARADRIHGAEGVIPAPVWIVLLLVSGVIFAYMLFFADSAERAIVQATMMGGVAVVITSTLLLLVESFIGPRWRDLYALALAEGYRFLSFGDCMFLER